MTVAPRDVFATGEDAGSVDLGVQLFVRSTRNLHLTPDGQRFYRSSVQVLTAIMHDQTSFHTCVEQTNGSTDHLIGVM